MRILISCLFAALLSLCLTPAGMAAGKEDPVFATINGTEYRASDFLVWWENWREKDTALPDKSDPFVDWQLLAAEAAAMQLDQEPSYRRKVQVFVRARALMLLKQEEVDSKIEATDRQKRKEEDGRLSAALVEKLRKKFHVEVDKALLASLDPASPDPALMTKPLVTSDKGPVLVQDYARFFQKDAEMRKALQEEAEERKQRTLGDFIGQAVTLWEAEDRHYEERPPLRDTYRFYRQHRLIMELEAKAFAPQAKVSDTDVTAYYEKHRDDFQKPESVRLAVLEDLSGQGEPIWTETLAGGDFFAVVKKHLGKEVQARNIPVNHLEATTAAVVRKLSKGETSKPFTVDGRETVVYLAERQPAAAIPLESVKEEVRKQLYKERLDQARAAYVARLREHSKVTVNDKAWKQTLQAATGKEKQ